MPHAPYLVLTLVLALAMSACASDATEPEPTPPLPSPNPHRDTRSRQPRVRERPVGDVVAEAGLTGELSISVERSARATSTTSRARRIRDHRDNQPFYVDAVIANEGEADLGGLDVPLYLLDSNGTLSPPWGFASRSGPCELGPAARTRSRRRRGARCAWSSSARPARRSSRSPSSRRLDRRRGHVDRRTHVEKKPSRRSEVPLGPLDVGVDGRVVEAWSTSRVSVSYTSQASRVRGPR